MSFDLDAFIGQALQEVDTAKKKGRKIKATGITKKVKEPRKKKTIASDWQYEKLICLVQRATCRRCQEVYIAPQPNLFVARRRINYQFNSMEEHLHKVTAYDADTIYSNLPRSVEYYPITVNMCHNCFSEQGNKFNQVEMYLDLYPDLLNQAYLFGLLLIAAQKEEEGQK